MKKKLLPLFITCSVFAAFLSVQPVPGQLIANHAIVADYNKIPQQYIDSVKKMWLVIAGESHSAAYRDGLAQLETSNSTYAVSVKESGTPDAYTTSNLRVSRGTWGDLSNATGWRYSYGEEDWFTSATAISRTKAGITYCNTNNLTISAFGLGWCWDTNEVTVNNIIDYLTATREYMTYCTTNKIPTKIIFTTGPVDGYSGEGGYNNYLRWQRVRDYVDTIPSAILFDYADILCWDDNGTPTTETWNTHTFSNISANSLAGTGTGHIGMNGALRIAKAMWWMLARMSGWDGKPNAVSDLKSQPETITLHQNYPNPCKSSTTITYHLQTTNRVSLKVFDALGKEVATLIDETQQPGEKLVLFDAAKFPRGVYSYRLLCTGLNDAKSFSQVKKLILVK
jgi:hypothetical protein